MPSSSPRSSLSKLGLHIKQRPIRVMIVGQRGVGKTAMVVRFITRRFIGEYDTNCDKVYTFDTIIDSEVVVFEITDAPGLRNEKDMASLEKNIQGADAFILMYSVTDKCSFDDCNRLKFLINYNKRRRKLGSNYKDSISEIPVILVGNKTDQYGDRMVQYEDGQKRYKEIACAGFHEISVRENPDEVWGVFRDVCRVWRVLNKFPKLKRSTSDDQSTDSIDTMVMSPDAAFCGGISYFDGVYRNEKRRSFMALGRSAFHKHSPDDTDEHSTIHSHSGFTDTKHLFRVPFRERASTDGRIVSRPRRWQYPPPGSAHANPMRIDRRMSISMRGSNGNCY